MLFLLNFYLLSPKYEKEIKTIKNLFEFIVLFPILTKNTFEQ